jgi:predicted negative regulator of RcsB-dependent stress response
MDADTRHQLKQNELAEALRNLVAFSDKRTTAWIVVLLVIALAYAGYKLWGWRQEVHLVQAAQALTKINATDASLGDAPLAQLRQLIGENRRSRLVPLARLKLAEGLDARAGEADGAAKLAEAETQYRDIINMPKALPAIKAPALYRLGIICETKRDFEQARQLYTTLSHDPSYKGSPFAGLAETRIARLDELAVPVVFEPGMNPAPPPLPTTQPARPVMRPVQITDQANQMPPLTVSHQPTPGMPAAEGPPAPSAPEPAEEGPPAPTAPEPSEGETPAEQPAAEPTEPEQP